MNEDEDDVEDIGLRDVERLEAEHEKDGYREGAAEGRQIGLQNGFEDAFVEKFREGYASGFALGDAEATAQVALSKAEEMRTKLFEQKDFVASTERHSALRDEEVPVVAFRRQSRSDAMSKK